MTDVSPDLQVFVKLMAFHLLDKVGKKPTDTAF